MQANVDLGFAADSREYGIGAQILCDLGVRTLRLLTNNPAKTTGIRGHGLEVERRVPLIVPGNPENERYLEAKRLKLGHLLTPEGGVAAAAPVAPGGQE